MHQSLQMKYFKCNANALFDAQKYMFYVHEYLFNVTIYTGRPHRGSIREKRLNHDTV